MDIAVVKNTMRIAEDDIVTDFFDDDLFEEGTSTPSPRHGAATPFSRSDDEDAPRSHPFSRGEDDVSYATVLSHGNRPGSSREDTHVDTVDHPMDMWDDGPDLAADHNGDGTLAGEFPDAVIDDRDDTSHAIDDERSDAILPRATDNTVSDTLSSQDAETTLVARRAADTWDDSLWDDDTFVDDNHSGDADAIDDTDSDTVSYDDDPPTVVRGTRFIDDEDQPYRDDSEDRAPSDYDDTSVRDDSDGDDHDYGDQEENTYDDEPRHGKKALVGSVVLAAAVVAAGGFLGEHFYIAQRTTVPSAISRISYDTDTSTLCSRFEAAQLSCRIQQQHSSQVRGTLINQSLPAGHHAHKGETATLTYSLGPKSSQAPNVANMTIDQAKQALYNAGMTLTTINEVGGSSLASGKTISTSVPAGKRVPYGTTVKLSVSNGQSVIPNWVGKTRDYAEMDAVKHNINVTVVESDSDKTPGVVLSQNPPAGTTTSTKSVSITVAKARKPTPIKIPNIIGKDATSAQTVLANAGFRQISTVTIPNLKVKTSQVTQVIPNPGQTATNDTNIVLIVSTPDVAKTPASAPAKTVTARPPAPTATVTAQPSQSPAAPRPTQR